MKMQSIVILVLLVLLTVALSGCGDTAKSQPAESSQNTERTGVIEDPALFQTVDATITIEGGKITPAEITVPKQATVLIINKEDTQQRISMLFYQALISVDVAPGESEYVTVDAKYVGRVAMKLNSAQLGGVTVTE